MTKKTKPTTDPNAQPHFQPGQHLGAVSPFIVTDSHGTVWRVDPNKGTATKVKFKF